MIGLKLFSKLEAARIAAAFFDRRSLINAIDEVRNGKTYIGISATYQGGLDSSVNALEDKAKYLLKHSDDVILRLDKAGSRWLTESASVLTMLFKAATEGNTKDAAAMVELLIGQGWDRGLIRQAFRGLIRQAFLRTPTNPMKLLPK